MQKRWLAAFLALCMMMTLTPFAFAADGDAASNTNESQTDVGGGASQNDTVSDNNDLEEAGEAVAQINGKGYASLSAAITAATSGDTIELMSGEYILPTDVTYTNKTLTIKAAENATVSFDMSSAKALHDANITFENLTFNYKTKTNNDYIGLQHASKLTYKNCTINGKAFLYAKEEKFDYCVFNQTAEDYSIWCYGAGEGHTETFTNCTFNSNGKIANVYRENDDPLSVTFEGCTFNSTKLNKSAINIKETSKNKDQTIKNILNNRVSINNCKIGEESEANFPTNKNGNSKLYMVDDLATNGANTTVIVDEQTVWQNGAPVEPEPTDNYVTLEVTYGSNVEESDIAAAKATYENKKFASCKAANEAYMALFGVTWEKGYLDVTNSNAPLNKYRSNAESIAEVKFYIHGELEGFTSLQSSGNQIDCTVGSNHQIFRTSYSIVGINDAAGNKAKLTNGNVQAYVAGGYDSMFATSGKLTIDNIDFTSTTSTTVGASATVDTKSVTNAEMEIKNCTFHGRLYVYDNFENNGKMTYNIHDNVFDGSSYSGDSNAYPIFAQCKGGNNLNIYNNTMSGYARGINLDHANIHAKVYNNTISVTDPGRSCIQMSALASAEIYGNKLELTGGNAFTLHSKLLKMSPKASVNIHDNIITGTGYLIYDGSSEKFTDQNLVLSYTENTVPSEVDTTRGIYSNEQHELSDYVDTVINGVKPIGYWTGFDASTKKKSFVSLEAALEYAQTQTDEYLRVVVSGDYTLTQDVTIPENTYIDVIAGGKLTIPSGVQLTIPENSKRLGVYGEVVNNGTIMILGKSNQEGKVVLMSGGVMDTNTLSVPEGYVLDRNGNAYFAGLPQFEITYTDGTVSQAASLWNLSGAKVVKLLKDVSNFSQGFDSTDKLGENFVLDLGGHTLTGKERISYTQMDVLRVSVPMTVKNGTIRYIADNAKSGAIYTAADVTIGEDVVVDGGKSYGIQTSGYGHTLTVDGTVKSEGDYAIAGNGINSAGAIDECNIIVNSNAKIEAPNGLGIYHPEKGTVTINGGRISGKTGVEMCSGTLLVKDGSISSTGNNWNASGEQNAILDGAAISIINRNYPGSVPTAQITGGRFQASGTDALAIKAYSYVENTFGEWTNVKDYVKVSGGYYTSDPSAYVVDGKSALSGSYIFDGTTYAYKVDDSLPVNVEVKAGNTAAKTENKDISEEVVEQVSKANVSGVTEKANEVAKETKAIKTTEYNKKAGEVNKDIPNASDASQVTTVVAPRLDITVKDYNDSNKTLVLEIEAVYDIKATTNTSNMVELNNNRDNAQEVNTVTIQENAGKLDTTGTPVAIRLALPAEFATMGETLYITHTKDSGAKYVHAVTVQSDTAGLYVEFTNDKGFSTFSVNKNVAASITTDDGTTTYYETLQDAVDAAQNGQTIKLEKDDITESAIVSRTVSFTLDKNSKNGFTGTIKAGANTTLKQNNDKYDFTYTRPSSGGSGGGVTNYAVTVNAATNGTVTADKKTAAKGTTVTITATASQGYVVDKITVVDKDGKDVAVTAKDGKYTFVMPGSAVTVTASFKADGSAGQENPFVDVKSGEYYYDAVLWAVKNGVTQGVDSTHFGPMDLTTRGQMVTFLWRYAGSPEPTSKTCPFTDVKAGSYYEKAVLWAVEQGITKGTSETTFHPDAVVLRGQAVTFLARLAGVKDDAAATPHAFTDVTTSDYFNNAVAWAAANHVTQGTSATTFSPNASCLRGQIVTFLYRAAQLK